MSVFLTHLTDDPQYVMIDLEFNKEAEAQALFSATQVVWSQLQGTVITNPKSRLAELLEVIDFA